MGEEDGPAADEDRDMFTCLVSLCTLRNVSMCDDTCVTQERMQQIVRSGFGTAWRLLSKVSQVFSVFVL
eukprot:m.234861 g.234861  ORF g.234861 m.234861 type:complete len:69 (+) comp40122_c0_seq1:1476-1682(+)